MTAITPDEIDDVAAGRATLIRGGKRTELRLSRVELAQYEAAKQRGFVEQRGRNERAWRVPNLYRRWCEAGGRVYIRVSPKLRYAEIFIDVVRPHERMTKATVDGVLSVLDASSPDRTWVVGSGGSCHSLRVPIGRIGDVVGRIFALVSAPGATELRKD